MATAEAPPPAPPAAPAPPPPTVQTADVSGVPAELKGLVATLRRVFGEFEASGQKRREVDDVSRKLGGLFVDLGSGKLSPSVCQRLQQLGQALEAGDTQAARHVQTQLTASDWSECSAWLPTLKRLIRWREAPH